MAPEPSKRNIFQKKIDFVVLFMLFDFKKNGSQICWDMAIFTPTPMLTPIIYLHNKSLA